MNKPALTKAAQEVIDYAQQVLGDKAQSWLTTPHEKLNGAAPMSVINSVPGRVELLIWEQEHGGPF